MQIESFTLLFEIHINRVDIHLSCPSHRLPPPRPWPTLDRLTHNITGHPPPIEVSWLWLHFLVIYKACPWSSIEGKISFDRVEAFCWSFIAPDTVRNRYWFVRGV